MPQPRPIILTAWIADDDLHPFHRLRERFFPKNRSFVSAHCTLFHNLPGAKQEHVFGCVDEVVRGFTHERFDARLGAARVTVGEPFALTRGVAYPLERPALIELRDRIREHCASLLTAQDARPWRSPHITVQNKVDAREARKLLRHLRARFEPCELEVLGVRAWRYDNGPWTFLEEFRFPTVGVGGRV